jgi:formate/nitrite transporter FocA (FNT family)
MTTPDTVIAIVPPIAAFVANAFEHSVANMYALAIGFLLRGESAAT